LLRCDVHRSNGLTAESLYRDCTYLLTKLSPSWEAANCAAIQEIPSHQFFKEPERVAPSLRRLVAGFPPRRPGFKPGSVHVGFCDGQKWRWGRFSPSTSVSPANLHSTNFSTIIFTITRRWHNRPGVAAVPIASQTKKKK
jgi:hypothetical protein